MIWGGIIPSPYSKGVPMANGDLIFLGYDRYAAKLLDAQVASDNGKWIEVPPQYSVRSYHASNLEEGAADATIDIMVSNALTKPTDVTDGIITATLSSIAQATTVIEAYRWVKAKKTAGTTPAGTTVIIESGRNG